MAPLFLGSDFHFDIMLQLCYDFAVTRIGGKIVLLIATPILLASGASLLLVHNPYLNDICKTAVVLTASLIVVALMRVWEKPH
jgi:hypothetical protein